MGVEKKMKSIGVQKASEEVNEQIVAIIGKDNVVEDGAALIVKPANDDELAKVIVKALEGGRDIAPVSRKNSHHNDILVDLSKMAEIIEIDTVAMTVKVQAGAKFMDVEKAVNEKGFTIGVRPAGADATVDQWVYTEEAGIGSYKYGTVKDSVYNVYAVDCNGELIETGYDKIGYYMSAYNLTQAYVASYGRVGIITAVTLKINPAGVTKAVAYQFPAVEKLQACMQKVAQAPSVKPLHISFCGSLAVVAFQGNEDFVDLDIEMMDAIASEFEGAKMDGADKWANIDNCDCVNRDIVSQVVPLRNLAALAAAVPADKIAGTVADRSTAVVKIIGAEVKKQGLTLLYHNHDFEFVKLDGKYALDVLYDTVPADLLQTELDVCWVRVGGEEPASYIRKYTGRAPVVHLKDYAGGKSEHMYELIGIESEERAPEENPFEFRPVGSGVQDMPAIIKAAEDAGAQWVVVEQDMPSMGLAPLQCIEKSRQYLKSIGV